MTFPFYALFFDLFIFRFLWEGKRSAAQTKNRGQEREIKGEQGDGIHPPRLQTTLLLLRLSNPLRNFLGRVGMSPEQFHYRRIILGQETSFCCRALKVDGLYM